MESLHLTRASVPPLTGRRLSVLQLGKFYPPHRGGMESHLGLLCNELRDSINLEVIVANKSRQTQTELVEGVKVTRLGAVANWQSVSICPGMARMLRRVRPDLIHIHHPNPMAILAYLASGRRGRLVITWHSDIVRQRLLAKPFWPFLQLAMKRSAALIISSRRYLDSSPQLAAYRDRCRVIPYGIPVPKVEPSALERAAEIRERYGPRIVLSVGRLVSYKGFDHLVRAMSKVRGVLLIVGEGSLRQSLERQAQTAGVQERVVLLGEVEDTRPYYEATDVFALASTARSEAFGIVQLEAMSHAKPVVNTQLDSGVPFVSVDGVTGITVRPGDHDALADAINRLLNDQELRARLGQAAKRRALQEFGLRTMVRRTLEVYREVTQDAVVAASTALHRDIDRYSALR